MATKARKVRKTLRLTQAKLDRARRILGTVTERRPLSGLWTLVAFRQDVLDGVHRVAGSGSLQDSCATRSSLLRETYRPPLPVTCRSATE